MTDFDLKRVMYDTLANLAHEEGINASGREEAFGCIFGRDTAITILKILKIHELRADPYLLEISRRALINLVALQGKESNTESGEEPGKFVHEFRREHYEHLRTAEPPWFLYPDNTLKNYDSLDSTPLALLALYAYWEATEEEEFLNKVSPGVRAGLNWMLEKGDMDGDSLLEFSLPAGRIHGGLNIQSWTDSHESFLRPDGTLPKYPIAPVEVQGAAWLAFKVWGKFWKEKDKKFSTRLLKKADRLKEAFNSKFLFKDRGLYYAAQGLDGDKQQIKTITANPLLGLWAAEGRSTAAEAIIDSFYIKDMITRAFQEDLFDSEAGLRTMSTASPTYNPGEDSYHNGSFWPMLNGLIFEGLLNFGFVEEAAYLKEAALKPIHFFRTPIELYQKNKNGYLEYRSPSGQKGCREQAWTAASVLHMVLSSN